MATSADFTTRARDEMYSIYVAYQALKKRVDDFTFDDMVAAFLASTSLIGAPTSAQKSAIIRARR